MLQMTHIQKVFRTELVETHALRELTLSVRAGTPRSIGATGGRDT